MEKVNEDRWREEMGQKKRREEKRREKYRSEEAVKKNARIIAVELRIRKKRREKK